MIKNISAELADRLAVLLADTYALSLKTQNYHWNVTGPYFPAYHDFFEAQYNDLFQAGDQIAERMRALGLTAPGSYKAFIKLTSIQEETGVPPALQMIKNLSHDHRQMIEKIYALISLSQKEGDEGTTDFLIERLRYHEKTLWMLDSTAEAKKEF